MFDLHTRSGETNVCQLRPERPNAKEVAFGAWYLLACFSDPTLRIHGSVLLARYLLNQLQAFFIRMVNFFPETEYSYHFGKMRLEYS